VPTSDCTGISSSIINAKLSSRNILVGDREQDIAVTITMPRSLDEKTHRPPLSLAIVIDRSGSMEGAPLANAKAAAQNLVEKLTDDDAFSIVTYSSEVQTVVPMTRASSAARAAAHDAINAIYDEGNTCISCGITQASAELARSSTNGVRRIVLISDGQANAGIVDRNELADLASSTAAQGISLSTVGVGLDFDELTMTRLADVGHGHYYFVEDTAQLSTMFASELAAMTQTVAADVRLDVTGANVTDVYGYSYTRGREDVVIPLADMRAGETRKVVLHVVLPENAPRSFEVAKFRLAWRDVSTGRALDASTNVIATQTTDAREVTATIDRNAVSAIETARTARVLENAAKTYETQGAAAAQQVIDRHLRDVHGNANVDAPALEMIERASNGAADNFAKAPPTKAMKATRADAYELAR
jgi:Ca-activated chloride channel family protein